VTARVPLLLLAAACAAGCASPTLARVAPALSTAPQPFFVTIAEGLTSPSLTEAMRVAPRMFSAPQLSTACQTPLRIDRLETPAGSVDLRVGERLALDTLRVVAINDANVAVPGVPVAIEVEETSQPVVRLRSDDPDLSAGRLLTIAPGTFRMRVRTICVNDPAEVRITGRVVE
jgi:hypothetical protein